MGDYVLFWSDAWNVGGSSMPLRWRLPKLFSFVQDDKISGRDFLQTPDLFAMLYLPISQEVATELQMLEGWMLKLQRDPLVADIWVWPGKSGSYTAKSFYNIMHSHLPTIQPCKWLWQSRCTMKI